MSQEGVWEEGKVLWAFYGLPAWKHPWAGAYVQELRDPSEWRGAPWAKGDL